MAVCQHRPFECIKVCCRGIDKCVTNFTRLTTVAHIIDVLLDDCAEKCYFDIHDCCLYVERYPYLFPLKSTDYIQDILLRYSCSNIRFKLAFKRNASPSRFAQRKKLTRTPLPVPTPMLTNAFEQLKIQESLIRRQQHIIAQLTREEISPGETRNYENYFDWATREDEKEKRVSAVRRSRQEEYLRAVHRDNTTTSRSLSRVRFSMTEPTIDSSSQIKSILKKGSNNSSDSSSTSSPKHRTTSVDRDIARLTSLRKLRNSSYVIEDNDEDDYASDQSTTDSCLGSLSSNDSGSHIITQHPLETLV